MRKVQLAEENPISIENLMHSFVLAGGNNIVVAYKAKGGGYRILSKLTEPDNAIRYGWISLDRMNNSPSFVGNSIRNALANAVAQRSVQSFESMEEMIEAMHKKLF